MEKDLTLWYQQPARIWEEVLPLGNGSLGAMVWGTADSERIGLNQESLWSGYYRDKNRPEVAKHLPVIRKMIEDEEYSKIDAYTEQHLLGEYGESYLPLGDLLLHFEHASTEDYRRELDLETGIATVTSGSGQNRLSREYFVSYPHQGMFIRLSGERINAEIEFVSELLHQTVAKDSELILSGQCPEHVDPNYIAPRPESFIQGTKGQHFSGKVTVLSHDGSLQTRESSLKISEASEVILMLTFIKPERNIKDKSYHEIKAEHLKDYQEIFQTVSVDFGDALPLPTDQRLEQLRQNQTDPQLYALYFQFARYLLIASSREGSLPANLQGIWSWQIQAPWSSNWTTNINLPMNYWLAQTCHLEACLPPYFDWLERAVVEGQKTAKINYGANGFVIHHNVDYWMNTNPVGIVYGGTSGQKNSASWAFWPMGGLWLSQELFRHYEYHQDKRFLKEKVYPILREACLFVLDWLVDVNGTYSSYPSTSPENRFKLNSESQESYGVTKNSAMDLQLIAEVFQNFQRTCDLLAIQDALLPQISERLEKLARPQIGRRGQLLEWEQEFIEAEPGHRHFSHLYGVFPGHNFDQEPDLLEASKVSLHERLTSELGHETTGWSCAWIINFYAVLQDGENAGKFLKKMLTDSTLDNLWGVHPPFQIDANFGGAAGIANMLVNERFGELNLLPALPDFLPTGSVKGLRLKGKRTIDLAWENHQLKNYQIHQE